MDLLSSSEFADSDGAVRFSMSARQRRGILVPAAMFAVPAVLAPLIPWDMDGNRQIIQICSWCIAPSWLSAVSSSAVTTRS
ncbi:hypothetical protein ABZW30_33975 [Kitasatospora sp. NPDC004669]|uniref:hypothetical protein n=1 Tax=Kitasatospora sp. NPDC004669 TaxID=3154555 RepID=UPI0033B04DF2